MNYRDVTHANTLTEEMEKMSDLTVSMHEFITFIKITVDNQKVMYRRECQLAEAASVLRRPVNRQPGFHAKNS